MLLCYKPVLWIRIGFNMDPGPAFYLNANPDPDSPTNPDPDPGQTLPSQKVEFFHEKYTLLVIGHKKYLHREKSLL
jgi:hypothetical protein